MRKNKPAKTCKDDTFISDQSISEPTLLINATFKTHNRFLKFIRLPQILPITDAVSLKLYFENLFTEELERYENVPLVIEYPDGNQVRPWRINLPNLKNKGDSCVAETEKLFMPEVAGHHKLCIGNVPSVQYADYFGITDRPYKQASNNWISSFYIYSALELRAYIISTLAIVISTMSLCFSIFGK
jgi:hypothetical protein